MINTVNDINLDEALSDLQPETAPQLQRPAGLRQGAAGSVDESTNNASIMIIDDESYNVLVVRKFLQHAGYENFVTTTESPK